MKTLNDNPYDNRILEGIGEKRKVMDTAIVDADYLTENIEYAFRAQERNAARDRW